MYRVDIAVAQDVSQTNGENGLAPYALTKTLFLDVVCVLNAHGIASTNIPAKLESLAFGWTCASARSSTRFSSRTTTTSSAP